MGGSAKALREKTLIKAENVLQGQISIIGHNCYHLTILTHFKWSLLFKAILQMAIKYYEGL